ncbi:MAG TPA: putative motility protein [Zoogloea sp.]|uniref:putative motility protein n=1 Tax=Zoogloea sp. TaxID=49181 RepID=UPI002C474508|nr:putative motility protein [Zoogloea sp.]HMV18887.1 putative motility protein [Rhodocyclaceae bacterium]HMV64526.1 putative motility protein [Rhodocyclaceae bacterium]HMW53309.1 putative motility protein [Rhodocyclaceae bacterium]HMY48416.1 putative motility protein [Rhodocyclaceae bacterium]HMZ75603.1 putative motility protein [Rhodocyclaceae bacterium]
MNIAPTPSTSAANGADPVSIAMLRKTLDQQQANAQQLLQALPQPAKAPDPTATVGRNVDVFA